MGSSGFIGATLSPVAHRRTGSHQTRPRKDRLQDRGIVEVEMVGIDLVEKGVGGTSNSA